MEMGRHQVYLRRIAELFGRSLKPKEYVILGRCIKNHTDEVLDEAILVTEEATTTNQLLYFLSLCSSITNKGESVLPTPKTI